MIVSVVVILSIRNIEWVNKVGICFGYDVVLNNVGIWWDFEFIYININVVDKYK